MSPSTMRAFRSSIQQKILLLLLGLALPPLLLIGSLGLTGLDWARATAMDEGTSALRAQAEESLGLRARDKALLYDQSLAGIQQQVESITAYARSIYGSHRHELTADRVWVAPMPGPEELAQYSESVAFAQQLIPLLRAAVDSNPLVSIGYIALDDGGVIAFDDEAVIDNLMAIQPFDPRGRPWYLEARQVGETIWTDAYVDANTGTLATTCATPLYDQQGRFVGVVAFDLLLATIQQDLLEVDIGAGGYAFLVSQRGKVIVAPDLQAAGVGWNETFNAENLLNSPDDEMRGVAVQMLGRERGVALMNEAEDDGQEASYIAYAPIDTAGWSVALVIPADEVVAPALRTGERIGQSQDRLREQMIGLLLLVAGAIGLLGLTLSLSFTRRIRALQGGVQAVAGGQLEQRLPAAGNDEIGQLVDAFNGMTGTLQSKVAELEENAQQLATLNAVSNELKGILDLQRLLRTIPEVICQRFGFDRAALYLVEGGLLRVVAASFGPGNQQQAHYFMEVANASPVRLDSPTVEADVVRSGKAIIVDNPWHHPRVEPAKQAASASHSYVQVPIFGRNDAVIGLLSADFQRTRRPIQPRDASQLLTFASMVGLTIENVQLYNELERQVAQRTEELRAALDRAQLADKRKSDFLASISHELRTPLNAIIGFSTVLLDGLDGPLTPNQREDAQSINRNGRFLLHLINELLDLARIEAGHLHLDLAPVELGQVTSEVLDTVQALLRDRKVVLHNAVPSELPLVEADGDRVRQILLNLLSNAIKFTERGTITVSATTLDEVSDEGLVGPYVAVSVADTGVGIPPEHHAEIFEEFVQIHGRRSRSRGTGLGLSIVRRLVQAQGGRIWVDSSPGTGSTFTFTLPVALPGGNGKGPHQLLGQTGVNGRDNPSVSER